MDRCTEDSRKLEQGCRTIYAGVPSSFALGFEDDHVPTFWLLRDGMSLQVIYAGIM